MGSGASVEAFEAERPRLRRLAARVLSDAHEAEDVVQQAWLRLDGTTAAVDDLPAWLTTVTTRLCLDRLRTRTPEPRPTVDDGDRLDGHHRSDPAGTTDPAEAAELADTVGVALAVVLGRLTPAERVAFVLHDSFGYDFATVAAVLETTPAAARKLASRARGKVREPVADGPLADWQVVDAFMAAAREGHVARLVELLAPDAAVDADPAAVSAGTPERIDGRRGVAEFFDGAAHAALAVHVAGRPGAAWFDRGEARVAFDFTVVGGVVSRITFRADPDVLATVARRTGPAPHEGGPGRRDRPHRAD